MTFSAGIERLVKHVLSIIGKTHSVSLLFFPTVPQEHTDPVVQQDIDSFDEEKAFEYCWDIGKNVSKEDRENIEEQWKLIDLKAVGKVTKAEYRQKLNQGLLLYTQLEKFVHGFHFFCRVKMRTK